MSGSSIETPDWSKLPIPEDDGAARHLTGMKLAPVRLPATDGSTVDLSLLKGRVVVYAYPRTGRPGEPNPDGWDLIPGARGCTPQTCSFRDHFAELRSLGVDHLFGLSTQGRQWQREVAERLSGGHIALSSMSNSHSFHQLCGMRLTWRDMRRDFAGRESLHSRVGSSLKPAKLRRSRESSVRGALN